MATKGNAISKDVIEALKDLAVEKNIDIDVLFDLIEQSLLVACKNNFGRNENMSVSMDRETGEYHIYINKTVVEEVFDDVIEISLEDAHEYDSKLVIGDNCVIEYFSKDFGRIAAMAAKGTVMQKLREAERNALANQCKSIEKHVVNGTVTGFSNRAIRVNLGNIEGYLSETEQVKGEYYRVQDRIKVYVVEVKDSKKGPRIVLSRTHPELVKKLFEEEVSEIRDGIVEIKSVAREAGSRSKIAVWSNDPDVDPVGACVGQNGSRVNAVVDELKGEKVDIVEYREVSAEYIQNALSPAKVIGVMADDDEKTASVIVPDYVLSLAIGKEGQNARLAAKLTNYKIDIKSETQAAEAGMFDEYYEDDEYDEEYEGEYEEAAEETSEE